MFDLRGAGDSPKRRFRRRGVARSVHEIFLQCEWEPLHVQQAHLSGRDATLDRIEYRRTDTHTTRDGLYLRFDVSDAPADTEPRAACCREPHEAL